MRFEHGCEGGPGRPRGNYGGRTLALLTLDRVLAQEKNQEKLAIAFPKEFDENPLGFFTTFVMPLLPKDINLADARGNALADRMAEIFSDEQLREMADGLISNGSDGGVSEDGKDSDSEE